MPGDEYLRALRSQRRQRDRAQFDFGLNGFSVDDELDLLTQGQSYRRRYDSLGGFLSSDAGARADRLLTEHASLGGVTLQAMLQAQVPDGMAVEQIADADDGGLGFGIVGDIVGAVADKGRDALHVVNEQAIKPVIRTAGLIGESAYHELSRVLVTAGTFAHGIGTTDAPRSLSELMQRYQDYGDSDLVNLVQGQGDGLDMGTGYFVGGALAERRQGERELQIRGQTASLGRLFASNTVGHMYDPGSAVYDVVAGVAEFGGAVALDPLAWATKPLAAGRLASRRLSTVFDQPELIEAAESLSGSDRLRFAAGLIDDGRKRTILAERTRDFLSDETLLNRLAEASSYDILQKWGRSSSRRFNLAVAARLGEASSPAEVREVLESLVKQGLVTERGFFSGPGYFVRDHLVASDNFVAKRLQFLTPEGRLSGISPTGTVHAEDLDTAALKYDSLLRQANVPRPVRAEVFDDLTRVPNGSFSELVKVHNRVMQETATAVRLRGTKASKLDDLAIEDLTPEQAQDLLRRGELEEVADDDLVTLRRVADTDGTSLDKVARRAIDDLSARFSEEFERMQRSAFRVFGLADEGTQLNPSYAPTVELRPWDGGETFTFTYPFPTATAELGSMALTLPDPTTIRRAATKNALARHVYGRKGWDTSVTLANKLTGSIFRPLALLRPAFASREFIEGQMSLAANGYQSMLTDPMSFLTQAFNLGEGGWKELFQARSVGQAKEAVANRLAVGTDDWVDLVGEEFSDVARKANILTTNAGGYFQRDTGKVLSRMFSPVPFDKASKQNLVNWTKELGRLRASPEYVAMARFNGNLEDWLDWALNDDAGRRYMTGLVGDAVESGRATFEDAVVELGDIVHERLGLVTGRWDDELVEVFRDGRIPKPEYIRNGRLHQQDWANLSDEDFGFFELLRTKFDQGHHPRFLKEEVVQPAAKEFNSELLNGLKEVIFNWAPSKFSRYPAFRESYVERAADLMDMAATDELRDQILERAVAGFGIKRGGPEYLRLAEARTRAKGVEGVVTNIDDYADLVRAKSVDDVFSVVFEIENRSVGQDTFMSLVPFLDAWKESMGRWSRFAKDNPAFFIRGMSGVRELQEQGTFYTNDFGDLVFQYPGSGALVQAINTLNGGRSGEFGLRMEGRVAGLNIATDSIGPGFGPLVQLPAALFQDPDLDSVRDIIAPFGVDVENPANLPQLVGSILPAWMDKAIGAFSKDYDPRQFNSTAAQFLDAFALSGKYDLDDPEAVQDMVRDAERAARLTLFARSVTQATAATGPGAVVEVPLGETARVDHIDWDPENDPQGKWFSIYAISSDYHRLAELYGYDVAGQKWFEMYGREPYFVAQGGSTTEGRELPVTKEGDDWYRRNQGVVDDYELVAGYFAPANAASGIDFTAMNRQYNAGQRRSLSAKEQAQLAMATRARGMWEAAKRQTEELPSTQRDRLRFQVKAALEQAVPGWQNPVIAFPRAADKITELRRAVDDPRLAESPLTRPLRAYFEARDVALATVREREGRPGATLAVKAATDVRAELREIGQSLQVSHPAFAGVWSSLLLSELEETE